MSFLHRRRSNRSRPSISPSPSPSPQLSSYGSAMDLSTGRGSAQPSFRKRFSTLAARLAPTFTPRPKPLSYTRPSVFDRHSSRSSSPTSPDIRPPSGLGRRASSLSLEYADAEAKKAKGTGMPNKTPLSITVEGPRESRLRCASSPDLLGRMGNPGVRTGASSPSNLKATVVRTGSEKMRIKRKPLPPLDLELHNELAQQSPRSAQRPPTPNRPPQRPVPTSAPPPPPTPSQDPLPSPGVTPKSPDRPEQSLAPVLKAARPTRARSPPFPIPLGLLLPHLPRSALPTLALISKRFRTAARTALYYSLDLSPSTSDSDDDAEPRWQQQVDACIALLASDASLAGLVHIFVCPVFPCDPPPPTFLFALTLALRNMPHLTSLTLPSLPPLLLAQPSAPFSLQSLTLLQSLITPPAAQSLFTVFLPAQSALHALALPHLDLPPSSLLTDELELSPAALALPKLASLSAPPTLAVALAPGRTLRAVTLHVASSLYDGLRPAHVMGALARAGPVRRLGIVPEVDGAGMDVRTLVKLCLAAGAELGEAVEELQLGWTLDDEVLYRQIPTILPRFCSLRVLRLTRPSVGPTPEPASPARSRATPPHLALDLPSSPPLSAFLTPSPESSTFFTPSDLPAEPEPEPEPASVPFPRVSPKPARRPRRGSVDVCGALDAAIDMSEADRERMHIATWAKAGPALREVVFLSGARWRARDEERFERVG